MRFGRKYWTMTRDWFLASLKNWRIQKLSLRQWFGLTKTRQPVSSFVPNRSWCNQFGKLLTLISSDINIHCVTQRWTAHYEKHSCLIFTTNWCCPTLVWADISGIKPNRTRGEWLTKIILLAFSQIAINATHFVGVNVIPCNKKATIRLDLQSKSHSPGVS